MDQLPKETIEQTTIFGWPLFGIILLSFLINILVCRFLTKRLLINKIIKKKSDQYDKVILMWYFPIVGMFSLILLSNVYDAIYLWKRFNSWLFLSNIK